MKAQIKNAIIFLSGALVGAAGTFVFVKMKWQKDFENKRNEMILYYENKGSEPVSEKTPVNEAEEVNEEELMEKGKEIIRNFNYSKVSNTSERTKNESPILNDDYSDEPYEIEPMFFGSQEMYDMVTLYLYDDGEVRTDKYELLDDEDVENYLGERTLERLADRRDADPELDAYYVRNDRLKVDYEILIEAGRYDG